MPFWYYGSYPSRDFKWLKYHYSENNKNSKKKKKHIEHSYSLIAIPVVIPI